MKRSFVLGTFLALSFLVAACVVPSSVPQGERPGERPGVQTSASPSIGGDVVYVRQLDQRGGVVALDAGTGKALFTLPWGITTPDWTLIYRVETDGARSAVRVFDTDTGRLNDERVLDGPYQYELPTLSLLNEPGGFSPNARWFAMQARGVDYVTKSALAVLRTKLDQPARLVELPGSFSFDALSDSGRFLYLEERLGRAPEAGYRVRVYDLQTSTLMPGVVLDKTANAEKMTGTRVATLGALNGEWQYTLYAQPGGQAFIHAIRLEEQWSLRLVLPVETRDEEDFAWAFVPSPDGKRAYVANGIKGYVAAIDLDTATILKTASFSPARSETSPLDAVARWLRPIAQAKSEMFAAGAVSPDGRTLYVSADFGSRVYVFDTASLTVTTKYAVAGGITGLALNPEGSVLYAMTGESLTRLEPATGRELGRASIAAIGMSRILHVASR